MSHIILERVNERKCLRLELAFGIRYECEHISAACILESTVLVELVQYDFRIGFLLELDYDTDCFLTVRLVSDTRDAFDLLLLDEVCDPLDQTCLVD